MTAKKTERPKCLGRYVAADKRALAAAKAARTSLIDRTARKIAAAIMRDVEELGGPLGCAPQVTVTCLTQPRAEQTIRAILEDVL